MTSPSLWLAEDPQDSLRDASNAICHQFLQLQAREMVGSKVKATSKK